VRRTTVIITVITYLTAGSREEGDWTLWGPQSARVVILREASVCMSQVLAEPHRYVSLMSSVILHACSEI
jgi:hypothetical protein